MKHKPDINAQTNNGNNALLFSAFHGNLKITKLLLENDADCNICSYSKQFQTDTIIDNPVLTLEQKTKDYFDYLIKNALSYVANYVRKQSVDYVFDMEADCSPLHIACFMGRIDIVLKLLLEKNPDVNLCNNDGHSPLIRASFNGYSEVTVRLLLERNPDVNLCDKDGWSPLLLLERNPDPCNNNTSISNSPSLVQPLLKHKPDINAQTYDGGNALYFSAWNGNIEITQLLLENNANCNICIHSKQSMTDIFNNHPSFTLNKAKQNIFDSLVKNTSSRVTEYVSKKSVDYAFDVVAGSSPLHIACFMGRINVVRCLIDHNANINMTKEDGTTPLFYACEVGYEDIVRLLLDNGADTQICRMDEKFPLDIATENGHTSIVMILTKHMKKRKQCNFFNSRYVGYSSHYCCLCLIL
ncbi:unnamed protein product [Mytilus edulis]|uniref:Uncharacterized protein n=1 Tax=Mytilus edulis TaxID=6550 RepID=A0A8S3SH32_MYTED|nr:unnamed protein product [Mytilus edulis]